MAVASRTSAPRIPELATWLQNEGICNLTVSFLDVTGLGKNIPHEKLTPAEAVSLYADLMGMIRNGSLGALAIRCLLKPYREPVHVPAPGLSATRDRVLRPATSWLLDPQGTFRTCDRVMIGTRLSVLADAKEPVIQILRRAPREAVELRHAWLGEHGSFVPVVCAVRALWRDVRGKGDCTIGNAAGCRRDRMRPVEVSVPGAARGNRVGRPPAAHPLFRTPPVRIVLHPDVSATSDLIGALAGLRHDRRAQMALCAQALSGSHAAARKACWTYSHFLWRTGQPDARSAAVPPAVPRCLAVVAFASRQWSASGLPPACHREPRAPAATVLALSGIPPAAPYRIGSTTHDPHRKRGVLDGVAPDEALGLLLSRIPAVSPAGSSVSSGGSRFSP